MTGPVNNVPSVTQADINAHTEQALIELVYVKTANDVLASSLASLQDALGLTKNILDLLTGLQTLHNAITVSSKGSFHFNFVSNPAGGADFAAQYRAAASAFFGTPVDPRFLYASAGAAGFASFKAQLMGYKAQLSADIPLLSAKTPALSNGLPDPNALLAKLRAVLADLKSSNISTFSGAMAWTLDNYAQHNSPAAAQAGIIQQHLTFAITAGESLNDTQKETVQNFLYVFEEYYKSASAVLTSITQIIQKMAENIAR